MIITLPMKVVDEAIKATNSEVLKKAKATTKFIRKVELEGMSIDKATLKWLVSHARENDASYANNLNFLYARSRGKVKATFTSLADLADAVLSYLAEKNINGWVFTQETKGVVYPWYVTSVTSSEWTRSYVKAYRVEMKMSCSRVTGSAHKVKVITLDPYNLLQFFSSKDIDHRTHTQRYEKQDHLTNVTANAPVAVSDLFEYLGLFKETDELIALYDTYITRMMSFMPRYGNQFLVNGFGSSSEQNYWGSSSEYPMTVDNLPGRAIMSTVPTACTIEQEDGHRPSSRTRVRSNSDNEPYLVDVSTLDIPIKELERTDIEVKGPSLNSLDLNSSDISYPVHPVLDVFHLEHHQLFKVHVTNMKPYKYRDNIKENLILPKEMLELSEMLVGVGEEDTDDIIENKSKATIIAAIGDPGLGKTLMAEIISEECQKPLYKIQAAQLGMTHEDLETNLKQILRRAEYWGCVLMIDEANAYVHERGHDIRQNAIVGVFLRLLEYFKGIMVLTTNHALNGEIDIDDAIISRCSAVFRFKMPVAEDAKKIWLLQAKLLKINLNDALAEKLSTEYVLSGRSIRNLLRLSKRFAASKEEEVSMKIIRTCAKYVPSTKNEGKASELAVSGPPVD